MFRAGLEVHRIGFSIHLFKCHHLSIRPNLYDPFAFCSLILTNFKSFALWNIHNFFMSDNISKIFGLTLFPCSSRALRVRKKMSGRNGVIVSIGDILCENVRVDKLMLHVN